MSFEQTGKTIERDFGADLGHATEATVEILRNIPANDAEDYLTLVRQLNHFLEPKI